MKNQINTKVGFVEPGSLADQAGVKTGDRILSINGQDFRDILEYRFLASEYEVELEVEKPDGTRERLTIEADYEDLGIEFEEGLIDQAQSCTNKCIFCFIDQLPPNMRETVYFKDDDTRLSFLQGNYVTLTNMDDEDIGRLIKMRISPINVSVHTTNPELRVKMLHNRFAGRVFDIMRRFAENRIYMNGQIVLCYGINDGAELERSLRDMASLYPYVNSISVVPVGLTRYREGLCPLEPYNKERSQDVIWQVEALQQEFLENLGTRLVYLSDEFYIDAGHPVPNADSYEGFPQIENGVGLVASLEEEFQAGLNLIEKKTRDRRVTIATGELAYSFMTGLARRLEEKAPGVKIDVYSIKNEFFGGGVNVTGLICGQDLIQQLREKPKNDALIISHSMLREEDEIFLDDTTVAEVEEALGIPVIPVYNDGYELIEKILEEELSF